MIPAEPTLAFRNLFSRHNPGCCFSHFLRILYPLRRSEIKPFIRLGVILGNASSQVINESQAVLRFRMTLVSRLAQPPQRFFLVPDPAFPITIQRPAEFQA